MTGNMYKAKQLSRGEDNDDYIVMETLTNVVALVNARTNHLFWVTKHVLGLEFELKQATPTTESEQV